MRFVNSARFRKYTRNNEAAAFWYHPLGSSGYTVAAASLDKASTAPEPPSSSPPSSSPPPEPPPADNFLDHVPKKFHDFASVFSPIEVENLPPHRPGFDASIELEEGKVLGPLYHLSQQERQVLFDYIESNLRKGFIRRSTSAAASPVLFVRKKSGELRLCVDYRGLNAISKKNRYPLPLFDDLLDRVQGCRVFSVLDLKNAFNLIRVREGDEWKTAFRTHLGLFEYTVMPFGLTNAPGIFQGFIQDTLQDLLDVVCVVYIDGILMFSRTQEEHDQHVRLVLERLRSAGLFANAKKCTFDQPEVEYLGYILGADGIKMHPSKLETIADWPAPASVKDVQSFLGLTNFYRRFIDNYAQIVLPLNALTKKASQALPFSLSSAAADAFNALKHAFTTSPLLRHFDPRLPSTLATDASDFAIAGVLHQPDDLGLLHPVAYFSRKLTPAEINYEVYDKELLAIVESFRDLRAWLICTDTPVSVVSDHKSLEHFMTSRILNRRQARWSMFLSEFNFHLSYAPGLRNPADAPSRRVDFAPRRGDAVLQENEKVLLTPLHTEQLFSSDAPSATPHTFNISAITTLSLVDSDFQERYRRAVRADQEWRAAVARDDKDFVVEGDRVLYRGRPFVPMSLRADILHSRHDSVLAGHPGREKTLNLVRRDFSWPGVAQYVRSYVRACDTCGRIKTPHHRPFGLLRPLDIPDQPWRSISMDFIAKLPVSHGYDSIWVVCDRLTRYAHFIPCNEPMDAPGLAWLFLDRIFRLHGLPSSIISDRGSTFVSKFWTELTALLQVDLKHSTSYHPQTDGLTERTNQTLETYLRAYVFYQQDDWADYLPLAEFAFNNHASDSTKQAPFFANYGFHPAFDPQLSDHSPIPAAADIASRLARLHNELRAQLTSAQERQSRYYNKRVMDSPAYKPDQLVWLLRRHIKTTRPSDKLDHRRLGPFPIDRAISDSAYKLRLPPYLSRLHPVFHVSLLEPYPDLSQFHPHATPAPFDVALDTPSPSIHSILDSRKLGQRYEYLVRWAELSPDEDSWVPLSDLPTTTNEMIERFHRRHPRTPHPPRSLLEHNALEPFDTNTSSISTQTSDSSPPSAASPVASTPMPAPATAPARRPAVAPSAPRPPSPAPVRANPRVFYKPPSQTTLRSGRVSRPPPPPDA
ncbi:Transposon Tf2-12 polyprotein [Trametes pubescens]|uniref:Transposon Tf2-12 polyprotein n=1 Tax=Trametes pubescens TaxID=154538 RepID=A0A1M2VEM8_TRAPU|nr:Transposon Tf2-12 polyprotein [Trametes pubescens]